MNSRLLTLTAIGTVVATLGLSGCNREDREAAKASGEGTVAQVDQKARELGSDAKSGVQQMGDKVDDAVITASVKTEIAKDSELHALSVNVDTDNGRVALRGTAPSTTAKEHATSLASGVKGVTSVDNRLNVDPAKK